MLLNKEKVLKFLPHRDPFLFIDSVESINVNGWSYGEKSIEQKQAIGSSVVAWFNAKPDLEIFKGHFPGKPVLPGVIQVEMMAQASSFVILAFMEQSILKGDLDLALIGVSEAKFRKPVLPGMDLKIVTSCIRFRGPIMATECKVFNNEELMSEATVLATVKF